MAGKVLTERYETLSRQIAQTVADQLKAKPTSCFGLPTGQSPKGCYKLLGAWSKALELNWEKASCFALDDYLEAEESITFQTFLEDNLYCHTNLSGDRRFNPRFVDDYDDLIASRGGLDLTLLGIGANGHIAFNEPGTPLESWTHCIWLTESTRDSNKRYFGSNVTVPHRGITMGIRTILESKSLILVASGNNKKRALERALAGPVDPSIPASFLSLHPNVTVLKDFN